MKHENHQPDKYEIEGSMDTLTRAEKIKHDPAMMKHVRKSMTEHMADMESAMKNMGGKKEKKGKERPTKKYGSYVYA